MIRRLMPVVALLWLAAPALAADKVEFKALKGTWEREADGHTIRFEFKDEKNLVCLLKGDDANKAIEFKCEYSLKDGVLSGTIKSLDKKGADDEVPPEGTKFSFKIEVGEKKMILSDSKIEDKENDHVNGTYTKKK